MAFDPVSAISTLVTTGLNKFVGDKMSEKDRETLSQNMEMFILKESREETSDFRRFVVEYEGAAKDVPKWILSLLCFHEFSPVYFLPFLILFSP